MNTNEFKSKLEDIRSYALDEFAEEVAIELRDNIQSMWYDVYTPENYDRTYELLNSVDIKETKAGRQVYINESTMVNAHNKGEWSSHIGVTGERVDSFSDMISENAQGNPKGGNKRLNVVDNSVDTDFYEATNDWVEKNIAPRVKELVVKELGKNGIKAKVSTGYVANIKGNLQQGIRIKI